VRAEAEALRTKTREQAALIDRLQRRLEHGYAVPVAMTPAGTAPSQRNAEDDGDGLEDIAVAGAAPSAVPSAARTGGPAEASRSEHGREVRALKARAEDQAGEIARLKAALAAFEQGDKGAGLKNSKLALKARAGSAEAQAERQAETINRLRAELAASHERLARQAAHFMDEMRRVGGGSLPASGQARRLAHEGERRKLIERVAQVRPVLKPENTPAPAPARAAESPAGGIEIEKEAANGHEATAAVASGGAKSAPATAPTVAEMPKTEAIPEPGRKLRLLDRITGLSKG
jgi:hypothetical protein